MIFTVAIDGPAAAGKGTIAKELARHFGFQHLDTGLLYRAVGAKTLSGQDALMAAKNLSPSDLTENLRTAEIAQAASIVAALPEVRAELVEFQRKVATQPGGAVLDGRDIGTVICPNADAKLYVTASAKIRAERRFAELSAKDPSTTREKVLADVIARDKRDEERATAPLKPASDAVMLDTSDLDIEAAVSLAIETVNKALRQKEN